MATLEGIALVGDPGYQMVAQVSLVLFWDISRSWHCRLSFAVAVHEVQLSIVLGVLSLKLGPGPQNRARVALCLCAKCGADLQCECAVAVQAYPFVVRKVLRDSSSGGARMLLRDMLFDASGSVKPARMSAVLNAALGYVADQTDGFVDFDAVPADGAPLQVFIFRSLSSFCSTPI